MDPEKLLLLAPALRKAGILALNFATDGLVTGVSLAPADTDLDQDWPARDLVMNVEQVQRERDGR